MKDVNVSYSPSDAPAAPVAPVHGFVGRKEVLVEIEECFQNQTILLMHGTAGIGKTEAAGAYARKWAEASASRGPILGFRFQHYVPLAQVCDHVGAVFAHAGKAHSSQDWPCLDARERRETALAILRQNPCLMLWDDFDWVTTKGRGPGSPRHPGSLEMTGDGVEEDTGLYRTTDQQDYRDFLGALRGGCTKVLLTSQGVEEWLDVIDRRIALAGLPPAGARELALRLMKGTALDAATITAQPRFNELLSFLEGNPLALQLFVPELRRKTPEMVFQALAVSAARPSAASPLDCLCRYRLDNLDPVFRRRLGVVGLFRSFVSARMLAAMSFLQDTPELLRELGREDWVRLLDAATDLGLLRRQAEGAYFIPPALQGHFDALLTEAFPDQVETLERIYCYLCGRAGNQLFQISQANERFATSLLGLEQYNLMRAYRLARQRQDWDNLKEILCGLRALLLIQGRWSEWETLVTGLESDLLGASQAPAGASEVLWLRLLGHRAEICEYRRDYDRLQALHQMLSDRYGCLGANHQQADVLHDLGVIAESRGLAGEAERFYQKSATLKQQLGEHGGRAATLLRLADLALKERHFREAEEGFRQALELWKQIGDADRQATTCCRLGAVSQERGEFQEAKEWYERSLAIRMRLGDETRRALALHQLGRIAHAQKHYTLAQERFSRSLELRQRIGDEAGQAQTLHQLGRWARDQNRLAEAERYFRRALQIRERLRDEAGQAQTIHQLGNVAFLQQQYDAAEPLYQRSLQLRECLQDAHGQARNHNQLGKIAAARGQADEAEKHFQRAESLFGQLQNPFSGLEPSRAKQQFESRGPERGTEANPG